MINKNKNQFKTNKNLKINFYFIILIFNLINNLNIKTIKKLIFNFKKLKNKKKI